MRLNDFIPRDTIGIFVDTNIIGDVILNVFPGDQKLYTYYFHDGIWDNSVCIVSRNDNEQFRFNAPQHLPPSNPQRIAQHLMDFSLVAKYPARGYNSDRRGWELSTFGVGDDKVVIARAEWWSCQDL